MLKQAGDLLLDLSEIAVVHKVVKYPSRVAGSYVLVYNVVLRSGEKLPFSACDDGGESGAPFLPRSELVAMLREDGLFA